MVKEVELIKQITKMGSRYIINIPKEYVQNFRKEWYCLMMQLGSHSQRHNFVQKYTVILYITFCSKTRNDFSFFKKIEIC